jgi:hypothetical protein
VKFDVRVKDGSKVPRTENSLTAVELAEPVARPKYNESSNYNIKR